MAESGGTETKATDKKFDVFLVHSSLDNAVASQINKGLISKGLDTYAHYQEGAFDAGKPIFDSIVDAFNRSKIVLILLTKNALESHWVTLEIILSLEKSQSDNIMCARLVLYGITEKQKEDIKEIGTIPHINLDFDRASWKDDLVAKIQEKVQMTAILPAGNVALGLVFNYFIGFLIHVLPVLKTEVERSDIYTSNEERMSKRFYILLPESCKVPSMEGDFGDYAISKCGSLSIETKHGDKKRSYNPSIYSIQQGHQELYFVGECPFIMDTIAKLTAIIKEFSSRLQVVRFRQTLEDLVNHRSNSSYNDTVTLLDYNDQKTSHAEEIWKAVEFELSSDEDATKKTELKRKVAREEGKHKQTCWATITHDITNPEDNETADEVMTFLEEKKKNVKFTNGAGTMGRELLREARWNVFVMSKTSIADPEMLMQYNAAITESINDDEVQVIPIISKGTEITEIPKKYRWTTVLKRADDKYLDVLWKTMKADTIKMTDRIPAGKVHEGLAYAYLLNYLPITLGTTKEGKDLTQRFKDAMAKYNVKYRCVPRVFVLVPKTCKFPEPGSIFEGEEHLGEMEPVVIGFRKYFLQLYRLTLENGEKVCYAREYATPAITLHEMATNFPSAGLNIEEMYEQSVKFASFATTIMNDGDFKRKHGDITGKCSIVQFDDQKEKMTAALERHLNDFLRKGDVIHPGSAL